MWCIYVHVWEREAKRDLFEGCCFCSVDGVEDVEGANVCSKNEELCDMSCLYDW